MLSPQHVIIKSWMKTQRTDDMDKRKAREIYEGILGKRVSDSHWYSTLKIFDDSLPLTTPNITWVGKLKKQLPKIALHQLTIIEVLKKSRELAGEEITGQQLIDLLEKQEISIHRNTLTKWFRGLNGFSRNRRYSSCDLQPIVLAAYAYKINQQITQAVTNNG